MNAGSDNRFHVARGGIGKYRGFTCHYGGNDLGGTLHGICQLHGTPRGHIGRGRTRVNPRCRRYSCALAGALEWPRAGLICSCSRPTARDIDESRHGDDVHDHGVLTSLQTGEQSIDQTQGRIKMHVHHGAQIHQLLCCAGSVAVGSNTPALLIRISMSPTRAAISATDSGAWISS